jgi:hypothetical protein
MVPALGHVEVFEELVRLGLGRRPRQRSALEQRKEDHVLARRERVEKHVVLRADAESLSTARGGER